MGPRIRADENKVIICPFTIIIDSREQCPYTFTSIRADADRQYTPIEVPTRRIALLTGDYAAQEMPRVCIERKSKEDLWSSVSQRRANFIGRLERMTAEMDYAAVVVEAEWHDAVFNPPPWTEYRPKSMSRTIIAWRTRFRVDWWFVPGREFGEVLTFRLLERCWRDKEKTSKGEVAVDV